MATPATALSEVVSKIYTDFPTWTRFTSSAYLTELDDVTVGATRYQLRFQLQSPGVQSSVDYQTLAIEVFVHHHLANYVGEENYTRITMLGDQATLLDAEWWRSIDSVFDLDQFNGVNQIELSQDVSRVGNVVSWGVLAVVLVVPD